MSRERFQLGEFWLDRRKDSPVWYIHWVEKKGKRDRTRRLTTGERDIVRAQKHLAKHFLRHARLDHQEARSVTIAFLLDRDFEKHSKNLASRDTVESATAKWKAFWGQSTVDDLRSEDRQREFIAWLTKQPAKKSHNECIAPSTIRRQLNVGRSALIRAHKRNEIASVPYVMTYLTYTGNDTGDSARYRVLALDEMAALFNAAAYTEHLWRYMLLMVGTCARPGTPLAISRSMIDFKHHRLNLLPPDHRQTNKRRPIIPICTTLLPWLRIWSETGSLVYRDEQGHETSLDRLVTWRGKRIKTIRTGFDLLRERAGIDDTEVVPYAIRHTMATWLAEQDVPDRELEIFMGHRMPGNRTTSRYIHVRPSYLQHASAAIDAYFRELAPKVERAILLSAAEDPQRNPVE